MEPGRIMMLCRSLMPVALFAALSGCGSSDDADGLAPAKSGKAQPSNDPVIVAEGQTLGTPMIERVAVLGLLKVVVRLRACEKTAPWETYPDHGAFVQLIVRERPAGTNDAERWIQVFSGWLFKENPAANVVEHPIYDIWVKACKMSFPGEEEAVEESDGKAAPAAKAPSSAPQSPAPAAPTSDEAEEETEA
jgi:Uncharacterized protein conserved in bacteria (DUF2155)